MASPGAVRTPQNAAETTGDAFRARVLADYEVSGLGAELLITQIARTLEELESLEADVRDRGVAIAGARGNAVANPSLAAIARHRTMLGRLVSAAFPSEHESASEAAARAARTRWRSRRGVT